MNIATSPLCVCVCDFSHPSRRLAHLSSHPEITLHYTSYGEVYSHFDLCAHITPDTPDTLHSRTDQRHPSCFVRHTQIVPPLSGVNVVLFGSFGVCFLCVCACVCWRLLCEPPQERRTLLYWHIVQRKHIYERLIAVIFDHRKTY